MDRTCERNKTRAVSKELGYNLAVPSKKNRLDPWEYDWENSIKRKNENERFFRRIKRFRQILTRYNKLDVVFVGFLLAMVF